MGRRRTVMIGAGTGVILLLLTGFLFAGSKFGKGDDERIAATVESEPVTAEELLHFMELERRATAMDYYHTYGANEDAAFWATEFEGKTPLQTLREKALQDAVRFKLQQLLARRKGLIDDISYSAFRTAFAQENKRRQAAEANGEAVYGPRQFTEQAYFDYRLSNLLIPLKESLAGHEIPLTEQLLREQYDSGKDRFYREEGEIQVEKIRLSYLDESGTISESKRESARKQLEEAQNRLSSGESFGKLAEAYNETVEERSSRGLQLFDGSTAREDQLTNPQLKEEALKLAPGQTSGIIEAASAAYMLHVVSRKPGAYAPFETVRDNVRTRYIEQQYETLVDRMAKEAEVIINHPVYDELALP